LIFYFLTIDRQSESKILATGFIRMLLEIYKKHKTNDQVFYEANTYRKLLNKIYQRQCRFICHVVCGEGMENLLTTGKIQGKRDKGRQMEKILYDVCRWKTFSGLCMIEQDGET
jgi:hypothetical protein